MSAATATVELRAPAGAPGADLTVDLTRARGALIDAGGTAQPDERFLAAHLVGLRIAAVVLAAGSCPDRTRRPRNAWRAVAEAVPALAGWAAVFAATEAERDAVRAGRVGVVSETAADELVRDTGRFLDLVEQALTDRRPSGPVPAARP